MNCACSGCLPLEGGFGRKITAAKPLIAMHSMHGHGPEAAKCGECEHVKQHRAGNSKFYKCHVYGSSGSNASDWRLKWGSVRQIPGGEMRQRLSVIRFGPIPFNE